ncbi:MAG TPA: helix-turn-helix transcriptional regulator [Acetobacteraceae bacterium]
MTPVDQHVGRRIRGKRRALGLTEDRLARSLGVDADTVRAYERGTERVPSEHLNRLSEIMEVPLSYFFPAAPCPDP